MASRPSWVVYLLKCSDGTLYTGATSDLTRRLEEHQTGIGAKYTRGRRPVQVVHVEPQRDMSSAYRREYEIKQLSREEKLGLLRGKNR